MTLNIKHRCKQCTPLKNIIAEFYTMMRPEFKTMTSNIQDGHRVGTKQWAIIRFIIAMDLIFLSVLEKMHTA